MKIINVHGHLSIIFITDGKSYRHEPETVHPLHGISFSDDEIVDIIKRYNKIEDFSQKKRDAQTYINQLEKKGNEHREWKASDKGGYLYVVESQEKHKIGITKNISNRISTLKASMPHPMKLIYGTEIENCREIEKVLHEKFKDKRTHGEWFTLTKEDIEYIKTST